ncbi:unnamed protein product [Boreogadus saida]
MFRSRFLSPPVSRYNARAGKSQRGPLFCGALSGWAPGCLSFPIPASAGLLSPVSFSVETRTFGGQPALSDTAGSVAGPLSEGECSEAVRFARLWGPGRWSAGAGWAGALGD